jgi:hypothetical protein
MDFKYLYETLVIALNGVGIGLRRRNNGRNVNNVHLSLIGIVTMNPPV